MPSEELKFTHFKNGRRGFTRFQIEDDEAVGRFYNEFKEWFDRDPISDNFYFRERPDVGVTEEDYRHGYR